MSCWHKLGLRLGRELAPQLCEGGLVVLKRLEPEARLRLAARLSEPEGVVV